MIYRVIYRSPTATYGPRFIEANSQDEAKRKFAQGAFSKAEKSNIHAELVPYDEVVRALNRGESL